MVGRGRNRGEGGHCQAHPGHRGGLPSQDRSSSPKLKPRKKPKQALNIKKAVMKSVKMTQGEELIPSKNFGETKPAPKAGPKPKQDNNNTVSRQLSYTTELGSTPPNPEMVLQSGRNIWPMTELHAGHVTEKEGAQPNTEQPRRADQKCGEGGHIEGPSDNWRV